MEKETQKPTKKDVKSHSKSSVNPVQTDAKTSQHVIRFTIIGIVLTLFNFILYSVLANLIFKNDNLLWLASLIGTLVSTILAYILHSKITWKERPISKTAIYKFFLWNLALAFIFYPALTQLFSLITPLYEFAYNLFQNMQIPFSYDFVLSTGSFVLASTITMIINFLFYDKFVFGKKTKESE